MGVFSLRPLLREDIPALVEIDSISNDPCWTLENFKRELELSHSLSRVALWESVPVGFGIAWKVAEETQILEIAVLPQHRRKGIATQILSELSKESVKSGCKKMVLEVQKDNSMALKFYEQQGLKIVGTRKNFYTSSQSKQNIDALLMECDLPLP